MSMETLCSEAVGVVSFDCGVSIAAADGDIRKMFTNPVLGEVHLLLVPEEGLSANLGRVLMTVASSSSRSSRVSSV